MDYENYGVVDGVLELPLPSAVFPSHFGLTPNTKPLRKRGGKSSPLTFGGHFSSNKAMGPTPFESLLERDLQTLVCTDFRIATYAVECHRLTYWAPNQDGQWLKRTYTPDIVARDQSGQIIIFDAKAKFFAKHPKWVALEPYIRSAYERDHGARFLVLTEEVIRAEPRLSNCQIMLAHRTPPQNLGVDQLVRSILNDVHGELLLGQITELARQKGAAEDETFGAVMRMALDGIAELDLATPFSSATRVKLRLA